MEMKRTAPVWRGSLYAAEAIYQLLDEEEDDDDEKDALAARSRIMCCRVTRMATTFCSYSGL